MGHYFDKQWHKDTPTEEIFYNSPERKKITKDIESIPRDFCYSWCRWIQWLLLFHIYCSKMNPQSFFNDCPCLYIFRYRCIYLTKMCRRHISTYKYSLLHRKQLSWAQENILESNLRSSFFDSFRKSPFLWIPSAIAFPFEVNPKGICSTWSITYYQNFWIQGLFSLRFNKLLIRTLYRFGLRLYVSSKSIREKHIAVINVLKTASIYDILLLAFISYLIIQCCKPNFN